MYLVDFGSHWRPQSCFNLFFDQSVKIGQFDRSFVGQFRGSFVGKFHWKAIGFVLILGMILMTLDALRAAASRERCLINNYVKEE